jgi:hypothetical protein
MCPVCAENAALAIATVTTTGGLTSLAVKLLRFGGRVRKSGLKQIAQRRDENGYSSKQAKATESRAAG